VLAITWCLAAAYVAPFVQRGWIPHDEGAIADRAERVLRGQVPHRDFTEGYTGALSYVHAAAFRAFGVRLTSLRWVLFGSFLLFVPVVYAVARRFASPWLAGALALLATVWTVPNYFASLPSWYNLFLAASMVLALLEHAERGSRGWLFAAGALAGVSILFKIVGLYAVAAGVLFLVYREQRASAAVHGESGRRGALLAIDAAVGAAFVALLAAAFGGTRDAASFLHFAAPAAAVVAVLLASERRDGRGSLRERLSALVALEATFAAGVAAPLALFAGGYALAGALPDLVREVLLAPGEQIRSAHRELPPVSTLAAALPYAALLLFPVRSGRPRRMLAAGAAVLLAAALVLARDPETYRTVWASASSLAVVSVLAGAAWLLRARGDARAPGAANETLFLLLSATAMLSLVQYPFAAPVYFCYVAPFVALAIAALVSLQGAASPVHACVLVFYLLFAAFYANRGYALELGLRASRYSADAILPGGRGGLRVPASDAAAYGELEDAIRRHSAGRPFYAGPDCPEVYFLTNSPSPVRSSFDFQSGLDDDPERLLRLVDSIGARLVVLNGTPAFSRPPSDALRAELARRFPRARRVGAFEVRWTE
jgi:hypothetical protein